MHTIFAFARRTFSYKLAFVGVCASSFLIRKSRGEEERPNNGRRLYSPITVKKFLPANLKWLHKVHLNSSDSSFLVEDKTFDEKLKLALDKSGYKINIGEISAICSISRRETLEKAVELGLCTWDVDEKTLNSFLAIRLYTSQHPPIYKVVNEALCDWDMEKLEVWEFYVRHLIVGLKYLKDFTGTETITFRGTVVQKGLFDDWQLLSRVNIGKFVAGMGFPQFVSLSVSSATAKEHTQKFPKQQYPPGYLFAIVKDIPDLGNSNFPIILEIHSSSAVPIFDLSEMPDEQEYLLMPFTRLKIVGAKLEGDPPVGKPGTLPVIKVEEIPYPSDLFPYLEGATEKAVSQFEDIVEEAWKQLRKKCSEHTMEYCKSHRINVLMTSPQEFLGFPPTNNLINVDDELVDYINLKDKQNKEQERENDSEALLKKAQELFTQQQLNNNIHLYNTLQLLEQQQQRIQQLKDILKNLNTLQKERETEQNIDAIVDAKVNKVSQQKLIEEEIKSHMVYQQHYQVLQELEDNIKQYNIIQTKNLHQFIKLLQLQRINSKL